MFKKRLAVLLATHKRKYYNIHSTAKILFLFFSSSSRLAVGSEVSGRADSSLPARFSHSLDSLAVPSAAQGEVLQEGTMLPPTVQQGAPRETLESILVALDTEK